MREVFTNKPLKPPCWLTHPALTIGGGKLTGGSCSAPPSGVDVHIGFSREMALRPPMFPWRKDKRPSLVEILLPVTDRCAPAEVFRDDFDHLVDYALAALEKGLWVHGGCLGGHGRTGMFLAAVVSRAGISNDAIRWVRKHYCRRAVESQEQVKFLVEHFDVIAVPPSDPPLLRGSLITQVMPVKRTIGPRGV